MVYNVTYTPADMAGVVQDFFGTFFQQAIVYAGLIILVVLLVWIIHSFRRGK